MKIHIALTIKDGPYGGSHSFLGALRTHFREVGAYAESSDDAEVIIFNSSQDYGEVATLRLQLPHIPFIQRLDGHPAYYNRPNDPRGPIIHFQNTFVADASIYQSQWARNINREMGVQEKTFEKTILNAPDPTIFFPVKTTSKPTGKPKLVATSWSTHQLKGFPVLQWLDENLDFDSIGLTFIGNSPIRFKNITSIPPMGGRELASALRQHDIYLFPAAREACSNALIEAMHCGLPVIAMDDGGNPEIVGRGGVLFSTPDEIPQLIELVKRDYSRYQNEIDLPDMHEVGKLYLEFCATLLAKTSSDTYRYKGNSTFERAGILKQIAWWKMQARAKSLYCKLLGN